MLSSRFKSPAVLYATGDKLDNGILLTLTTALQPDSLASDNAMLGVETNDNCFLSDIIFGENPEVSSVTAFP